MRLFFVTRRYWPARGGIESFLRHLARELGRRHDVTVLAQRVDEGPVTRLTDSLRAPSPFEPFRDGDVNVEPLVIPDARRALMLPLVSQVVPGLRRYAFGRVRRGTSSLYARAVGPLIADRSAGADVLHMFGGDMLGAAVVRAGRLLEAPIVITPFAHRGQWGDDPGSAAAYRAADRVVALLDADAAVYEGLGVAPTSISVVGVCSPGVPVGQGAAIRSRFAIDGPLVLYLAVRRPYKGFDLLLDAAELVATVRPDVTFAFAGPGPSVPGRSEARVIDAGAVDDEERAGWLEAADLLCLPSEGEIFPVSVLEAWSVKTPVLTTNLATLKELVAGTRGGRTAPREAGAFAESIIDLLDSPTDLRSLGDAGNETWRSRYTVEAVAQAHEQLYAPLVHGGARCAA